MLISQIYFVMKLYMFQTVRLVGFISKKSWRVVCSFYSSTAERMWRE